MEQSLSNSASKISALDKARLCADSRTEGPSLKVNLEQKTRTEIRNTPQKVELNEMVKAMVLAAGVGSRLEPISSHIPKPLVPVLNRPVMEHILALLHQHGITDVVSNTHHMADLLQKHFEDNPPAGMKISFFEETELTGDAGGVRAAREFLEDDTFIVIMGDLITNANLSALIEDHKRKGALATIAVKQVEDVTRFGVMRRDADGFIQEFQEKPAAHEAISNDISTGIYILEPEIFKHIPSSGVVGFGRQIFPSLVSSNLPVLGSELEGYWSDIGTLQDLFRTNIDALHGIVPVGNQKRDLNKPEERTNIQLGRNVEIAEPTLLGANVIIQDNTKIGEDCIIGNDTEIGSNCQLKNCVIFADSKIESKTNISDCILAFGHQIKMTAPTR